MGLRYRLFLWVAGAFCITFIASFFLEDHLTRINLKRAYGELLHQLDENNERKIEEIEYYLDDMLNKIRGDVDAVLHGVSKYRLIKKGFVPTLNNLENSNWLDAASLLITNKWIAFMQSTNEEALMSGIIVDTNPLNDVIQFPRSEEFNLVAVKNDQNVWEGPFIGISMMLGLSEGTEKEEEEEDYFAFFTPKALLSFKTDKDHPSLGLSVNLLEPFLKWMEIPSKTYFLADFLERIDKAQNYYRQNPDVIPDDRTWQNMVDKKAKTLFSADVGEAECYSFFLDGGTADKQKYKKQSEHYVKEFIEHYNKVGLAWGLSTLTHADLFGKNPLGEDAPIGLGIIDRSSQCGKVLLSRDVFYDQKEYDVEGALKNIPMKPDEFVTSHLDVIALTDAHQLFFGNTLKLQSEENGQTRTGYLTVGMDGTVVLGSLALSTHHTALFISKNAIISVSNPQGNPIKDGKWYEIPSLEILSKRRGIINVGGEDYYFLHVSPSKKIDLHFFTFTPKKEEFAMVNSIKVELGKVLETISLQMRLASIGGLLVVLIFLNNIAKRITRPISHLAELTGTVAEGKLHEIEIPKDSKAMPKDEVSTLYNSFFEMVKGLREKERVRGVLNKVVSKEIAEETLKGKIQLGGEEKRVTVFFADIRNFTEITEHMDPKEVIELVNTCMTKVSDIIDKHGGVIDKYVGDEVMALFGAPIEKKDSALQAIKCGIDIVEALKEWNKGREGKYSLEMGIGIHTGTVVAGNMGAENRLNYTVLGSNVNLASRLCSQAKEMQVLISQNTLDEESVKNNVEVEEQESVVLKGFTKPVPIFHVKRYK